MRGINGTEGDDTQPRSIARLISRSRRPAFAIAVSALATTAAISGTALILGNGTAAAEAKPVPQATATPAPQDTATRAPEVTASPAPTSATPQSERPKSPSPAEPSKVEGEPQKEERASAKKLNPPPVTTGPSGAEKTEVDRASKTAGLLVDSMNQISKRDAKASVGVDRIATGFVLGELQAQAQEQEDLGYRQIGEAKITSVKASALKLKSPKPSMTLTVCVDVSGVDVVDAAGKSLKASLYNPGRPVKHVYGAELLDNAWKIATHVIPDTQDCEKTS